MLTRATDAAFINDVVNHPAVRPYIHARPGRLDMSAVVSNRDNLVLVGEHGGMIMVEHLPGLVELHTQVLPDGRGPWALEMAHQCMDWLFSKTRATEIFTRVPENNLGALALTRACGARLEETVKQELSGERLNVAIYGGRIQDWIKVAPGLIERGQAFHVKLHARYKALGLDIETHPENAWHNRHVGAAVGMVLGGQVQKGMVYYNRWAAMAMAPAMKIVSNDPLVIDITESRIEVHGDDFEVVPCRAA